VIVTAIKIWQTCSILSLGCRAFCLSLSFVVVPLRFVPLREDLRLVAWLSGWDAWRASVCEVVRLVSDRPLHLRWLDSRRNHRPQSTHCCLPVDDSSGWHSAHNAASKSRHRERSAVRRSALRDALWRSALAARRSSFSMSLSAFLAACFRLASLL